MKKLGRCLLVSAVVISTTSTAHAFVVYDPANWAENFLTAIRAEISNVNEQIQTGLQETVVGQQLMQLANEAKMLANDLLDLTKLPGEVLSPITTLYNGVMGPITKVNNAIASAENMANRFQSGTFQVNLLDNRPPQISAIRKKQYEDAMERNMKTMEVTSETASRLPDDASSLTNLLSASRNATGNLGVQQAGNELVGANTAQLIGVKSLLATQIQMQAEKDAQEQQAFARSEALDEYFLKDLVAGSYVRGTGF